MKNKTKKKTVLHIFKISSFSAFAYKFLSVYLKILPVLIDFYIAIDLTNSIVLCLTLFSVYF